MYHSIEMVEHCNIRRKTGIAGRRGETREDWFERAAMSASLLCLIHCLALPLIIAALPVLSSILTVPESFHVWVLAFAVPASGAALIAGRTQHGEVWPLALGALGLILLAIGAMVFGESAGETPITVAGSLLLAAAHIGNWRLRHEHSHKSEAKASP